MPFNLAHCEIFNPNVHGHLDNSFTNNEKEMIYTSYLFHFDISYEEFYNDDYIIDAEEANRPDHPLIRNWTNSIKPYSLQIVEKFEYRNFTLCVIKTFWIKIIQKRWKRYYNSMLSKRRNIKNLRMRELNGKW